MAVIWVLQKQGGGCAKYSWLKYLFEYSDGSTVHNQILRRSVM